MNRQKPASMFKILLPLLFAALPFLVVCQNTQKVLVIGIDGCRPDALQVANTPNMDGLIANGIFSPDALNDDITISGPGWSAILCGVWSPKHLVTGNNFSGNNYENYPPITKYIKEYNADLHTVSICHWGPINDHIIADNIDFKLNVGTDLEVSTQGSAYLAVNDPDFMFVHFDDCDHAGHSSGFSPEVPEYIEAIEIVDGLIGGLLEAIEDRPNYDQEDWLILITTDHGGNGTSHGGSSFEEENVFVIASGNSIEQQLITKDSSVISNEFLNCLDDTTELSFNQSNDFVQIPAHSNFDFGADQDFTIECRVRTPTSADVAIVGNKDWDSGNNAGFVFSFKYPSGPEWKVNIGDGNSRADINTGGTIADNEWHTLSVSFDRDGFMKMYEDGVLLDSANISSIGDITTNQGLFIGSDILNDYDFDGSIAEVRVWNTVLEGQTIQDWYCNRIDDGHPQINELLGYWHMNEGTGDQIIDYSGFANHGINNGTIWDSTDSLIVYDYSSTPRITDIPVTALTHLCIPIEAEWDFDGQSLIPICVINDTDDLMNLENSVSIYPNPAHESIQVFMEPEVQLKEATLEIFQATGEKVYEMSLSNNRVDIDVSQFKAGVYYICVETAQFKVNRILVKP